MAAIVIATKRKRKKAKRRRQWQIAFADATEELPDDDEDTSSTSEDGHLHDGEHAHSAFDAPEKPKDYRCPYQKFVYEIYQDDFSQISVAILIFMNFLINAAEVQWVGDRSLDPMFTFFECFFTIVFTIELVANLYGSWFATFWKDPWNLFDFIVVIVSIIALFLPQLPGVSTLRLLRAFRVFRLFKRLKSLRKILTALVDSIPGVINAGFVLLLVMSIYAILAVGFFGNKPVGGEDFRNFSESLMTMFQLMTGDWGSYRPIINAYPEEKIVSVPFFVSYILITSFVLVNVVIAVLLEHFVDPPEAEDDDEEAVDPQLELMKSTRQNVDRMMDYLAKVYRRLKLLEKYTHEVNNDAEGAGLIQLLDQEGRLMTQDQIEDTKRKHSIWVRPKKPKSKRKLPIASVDGDADTDEERSYVNDAVLDSMVDPSLRESARMAG